MQRRPFNWVVALVGIGLAGVVAVSAASALAARSATSAFELTLEGREVWEVDGDALLSDDHRGTFTSRAPFCATGTIDFGANPQGRRFVCDDGTGSLTVSIAQPYDPAPYLASWNTTWRILEGSGSYADLRGKGSLRGDLLDDEISDRGGWLTWRSTIEGVVDRDAVAPTLAIASAQAAKLRRPAGAYALRLGIALRDNLADNPVSYTLRVYTRRVSAGGHLLAERLGTAGTDPVSMTLRIRPPAGARAVRLVLSGSDPIGNQVSITRSLKLPR
jgi:hypothetical protein